jgi:phage baseplate assembly protein W
MTVSRAILGKGFAFPFAFDADTGGVAQSEGLPHVSESLEQIIGTVVGERLYARGFGSRTQTVLFEPTDPALVTLLEHYIQESAIKFEPRVEVLELSITIPGNRNMLLVSLTYRVIQTNVVDNLVYPFYLSPDLQATEGVTG